MMRQEIFQYKFVSTVISSNKNRYVSTLHIRGSILRYALRSLQKTKMTTTKYVREHRYAELFLCLVVRTIQSQRQTFRNIHVYHCTRHFYAASSSWSWRTYRQDHMQTYEVLNTSWSFPSLIQVIDVSDSSEFSTSTGILHGRKRFNIDVYIASIAYFWTVS